MKKILMLFLILAIFLFVFIKSNTWQTSKIIEKKGGVEYITMKHSLHWDKFFYYAKNIPKKIFNSDSLKNIFKK